MKVVVDTNCLLASFSKKSPYRWLFNSILHGELTLVFTTDILLEYEEIISRETSREVAQNLVKLLIDLRAREQIEVYYFWNLIPQDPDDNKFVDCAIAANADYLITHDRHYNILQTVEFPKVRVATLPEFLSIFNRWKKIGYR
ncbi:MAG: putative toxin-antitoxin system toxin component, PIN family [Tunicatimonas sp.]